MEPSGALPFKEDQGFEPWEPFGPEVFKTSAINHSTNPPKCSREDSNSRHPGYKAGVLAN